METKAKGEEGRRTGVILVHGIGDIEAGAVVDATVDALDARGDVGSDYPAVAERRRLEETAPLAGAGRSNDYPYIIRRGFAGVGRETVFAELYWSDVKSIDARRAQPLLLFLGSLLQAHRLISALLKDRSDRIAMTLRPLLLFGAFLLRGPVVGLNLVLLILLLAIKYCAIAQEALGFQMQGFYFVVGGFAFSALVGAMIVVSRTLRRLVLAEIGWAMLLLSGLGLAGAAMWSADSSIARFSEFEFFTAFWLLLSGLSLALAVVFLLAAVLLIVDLLTFFRPGAVRTRRSAWLATAILLFQALLWTTTMRLFWLTLGDDLASTIDRSGSALLSGPKLLSALQYSTLLNIVILAAVFAAIVVVGLLRQVATRTLPRDRLASGRGTPRLIISPAAILVGLVLGVCGVLASIAIGIGHGAAGESLKALGMIVDPGVSAAYDAFVAWLDRGALEFAASSLVVVSPAAVVVFRRLLTQSSFLLQDIIDYQPDGPTARRRLAKAIDCPETEVASVARARIRQRFVQVLADLLEREKVDKLIIVAHSQGSVIVFDLLPEAMRRCEARGAELEVVTLGSPLGYIYAHYFEEYADLGDTLNQFQPLLRRWTNFYRIDDAIGGRLSDNQSCFVEERPLPPGGHSNYWREAPVGDAILASMRDAAR